MDTLSAKTNILNSKELLEKLTEILNNCDLLTDTISQDDSDACTSKPTFCQGNIKRTLFNGTNVEDKFLQANSKIDYDENNKTLKKKREITRKIGTQNNRPLKEYNIYDFISNFYNYHTKRFLYFPNKLSQFQKHVTTTEQQKEYFVKIDDPDLRASNGKLLFNEINNLYNEHNPYPWIECSTFTKNNLPPFSEQHFEVINNINQMMVQLLWLIVGAVFFNSTSYFNSACNLFAGTSEKQFLLLDALNTNISEILTTYKPQTIKDIYLINKPLENIDSLLDSLRPDYRFWNEYQNKQDHSSKRLPMCNPFYGITQEQKRDIVKSMLHDDDLLIIDTENISTKLLDFFRNDLSCKIFYIIEDISSPVYIKLTANEKTPQITSEFWLNDIISHITNNNDTTEINLLQELANKLGFHIDLYKLFHKYYLNYERQNTGSGKQLLEKLISVDELSEINSIFNEHGHTPISIDINGRKSQRNLDNAISFLYQEQFSPAEQEMLRFLCRLQEINSSISYKEICIVFEHTNLYKKLISYGWLNQDANYIPKTIAAGITYETYMSNVKYDFYLDGIIFHTSRILLGHTKYFIREDTALTLIKGIHEQIEHYLHNKSQKKQLFLKRNYFNKLFGNDMVFSNYQNSSLFQLREQGYFNNAADKEQKDPFTNSIFHAGNIFSMFYYSALIYCYEHDQKGIAENITNNFSPSDMESALFIKCYEALFEQEKTSMLIILNLIHDCFMEENSACAKPVIFVYLHCVLKYLSKFYLAYINFSTCNTKIRIKDLILNAYIIISQAKKLAFETEYLYAYELASISLYESIINPTESPIEVTDTSTIYEYHKNVCGKYMQLCLQKTYLSTIYVNDNTLSSTSNRNDNE